uniref:Gag-Pol polyprotein n=1 Tax=Tanacetum cinerariifolium TaxID=118510 RepID=A0A6L2JC92_TANCI|nr:Gag-Pol polyprotein [Tanacetum cinerariifolium]
MKAILRMDKCLVANGERPDEVTDDNKWDDMDRNAIANLYMALTDGVLSSIKRRKVKMRFRIIFVTPPNGVWTEYMSGLYCRGKENGVNILKSIDEGPYQMGTVRETLTENTEGVPQYGSERPRVYSDLTSEEKDRYNADIRATNRLLQGLPKDIYTLINHYTDAKDIWDNVKMLLERSELTKEDRESQLYDDFKHFRQYKRESIHDYYVRFAKFINDMRNIKMTMSRLQLNSKFVNNMLPEWGRFVTAVKLNRGLRDSNYDQLYAYLKQHDTHAKENKMMLERFSQPTGAQNRVGNVNQGQARTVKCYNCNGTCHIVRNCTQPKPPQNYEYYKDKMLLMHAQENRLALDAEQLLFLVGGQDNAFDDDVDEQPVQDLALNVDNVFQADDCDAFDSDLDEAPTAQTMFMANLSSANPVTDEAGPSYDSDILSEVPDHELYQDAAYAHHEGHVAIGYKNPLCLTRAKQIQPALYNGHEIIKENHTPAIVHNAEDTLEIAEITRKKMNAKMNNPECVTRKVNISPHDYSKENFLATFTPQKQLTPGQIFWSNDLMKLKSEALKKRTNVSRPIKAFTLYPPNTPATLVPKITPTRLTEGEMGFEQTKECYLKKVIPFFKTLKDNFEGIQKALTKEIKEIKDVFEELEAKVAQYAVDSKHDVIERKNLLIANDNLIAACLSQDVFSVASNSELNVARRCWVYPIKKYDVFKVLKVYKAPVELDSGKKIKCFRMDNGGKYTGDEFDTFYKHEGIKRQFTMTYTPQQNGVAERMNKTWFERARAMLATTSLEKLFWAEAVNTACYVINRSSSTIVELKTPIEMWTQKPVNYSDLNLFGSPVYVMYNTQETTKLDPKFRKCLFLGYANGVKEYHLWDPAAHKVENEFQSNDSFEASPQHQVNETNESQAPATRTFNHQRKRPRWHSDYVIERNVAYCLLTEEGEPSTL